MDPLSEIMGLTAPQIHASGSLVMPSDVTLHFPQYQGITCCAMLVGQCWLVVDGVPEPVLLHPGDWFLLPHGSSFRLATDLSVKQDVPAILSTQRRVECEIPEDAMEAGYIAGAQFELTGDRPEAFLHSLPPLIHIQSEAADAAMNWLLERMREELQDQQPGRSLMVQQLAYMMLIQTLRLYSADRANSCPSWLCALSDKHMSAVLSSMHKIQGIPGRCNRWPNVPACHGRFSPCASAQLLGGHQWSTSPAGACSWQLSV